MKLLSCIACIAIVYATNFAWALNNGVARTPPMGFLTWQRYRCDISCMDATSKNCFNERLIKDTADAMVALGYKDAGYEYVALDDCWQAPTRTKEGAHLQADPDRFPGGMKELAAYVHSKGLKFGIYTAMGNQTCAMGRHAADVSGVYTYMIYR